MWLKPPRLVLYTTPPPLLLSSLLSRWSELERTIAAAQRFDPAATSGGPDGDRGPTMRLAALLVATPALERFFHASAAREANVNAFLGIVQDEIESLGCDGE